MQRARCLSFLCALLSGQVQGAELIELAAPPFLIGPSVARAATGNTYSYRATDPLAQVAMQITVVEIPGSLAEPTTQACADAFLAELSKRGGELFVQRETDPLPVGPLALDAWRWTRSAPPADMQTGVVGCAVRHQQFIAVTFEDAIQHAAQHFPKIRASLRELRLK